MLSTKLTRLSRLSLSSSLRQSVARPITTTFSVFPKSSIKFRQNSTLSEPKIVGEKIHKSFKAETSRLLDIVAKSLYSDKEACVRELTSNASDALEKLRYLQITQGDSLDVDPTNHPLEITVTTDKDKNTLTIADSGIGMTEQELEANLGTIAHSGTRAFVEKLENASTTAKENLIGQFGVGFFSALAVADKVDVYTKSAQKGSQGYLFSTDGKGSYDIAQADNVPVGTRIVLHLKPECSTFSDKITIQNLLKKYSNFISFPINLDGERTNTIGAIWTKNPNDITQDEHNAFYQFISHTSFGEPQMKLLYRTDSPLMINALLYIPDHHNEMFGMGRMKPGVSLFSRKVLIVQNSERLLPEWLRFVKGVIDSEDVPLNISREHLQDSALVARLRTVLTARICKWLDDESRKEPEKYATFWGDFGLFLKEGACTDAANRKDISKLLRYETNQTEEGKPVGFKEIESRFKNGQKDFLYVISPTRGTALESPYVEPFIRKGWEVIICNESVDEFVMNNLQEFNGKKILSVESREAQELLKDDKVEGQGLPEQEAKDLTAWFDKVLGDSVAEVHATPRHESIAAIIIDPTSPTLRRLMTMAPGAPTKDLPLPPQKLDINPNNPLIISLSALSKSDEGLAKVVAEQIFDNCLIQAGLLDDPRTMLKRLNTLLTKVVEVESARGEEGVFKDVSSGAP